MNTQFAMPQSFDTALLEQSNERRRVDARSERALEALTHAIHYLTEDFVRNDASSTSRNAQLKAVQLLADLNRQVYEDCELIQPFSERVRSIARRTRYVLSLAINRDSSRIDIGSVGAAAPSFARVAAR